MYVFDTGPLFILFKNFYRSRFPTLWANFDRLVADGDIVSTREVLREIEDGPVDLVRQWSEDKHAMFPAPTAAEAAQVAAIYRVPHFQQNIEQQKLLKGGRCADPFVVARARAEGKTVVTMELLKPNAAKVPNICQHFGVPCLGLEDFMAAQNWQF